MPERLNGVPWKGNGRSDAAQGFESLFLFQIKATLVLHIFWQIVRVV